MDRSPPRMGCARGLLVTRAGDITPPFSFFTEGEMAKATEKKLNEGEMAKVDRPDGTFPMWMYLKDKSILVADADEEAIAIESGFKETPEG